MGEENKQPIIIKKIKKGGHGGHHGGAWKVAFADFMTAMMAFFLVMWLVGQSPEVRESVAGYFRDPGKFQNLGKDGVLKGAASAIPLKSEAMVLIDNNKEKGMGPDKKEKEQLSLAAKKILKSLKEERIFKKLKDNIKIQMTSEGLRIILNESEDSPAFFEPGSAKLLQESAVVLIKIARELGNLENRIVVEGHTDASYSGSKDYTNWELSVDRANSARMLMSASGLSEDQIREVRGFADQFPMILKKPNDARNRRISMVVLYKSRESQYDRMEVGADLLDEIYN
ncbi:MAG: flagellar motor protein MotB [candidate division Zixibacteria bacterium]|nr:flagellar motor protein MotB [candidate division Zixibacteria bacterium]